MTIPKGYYKTEIGLVPISPRNKNFRGPENMRIHLDWLKKYKRAFVILTGKELQSITFALEMHLNKSLMLIKNLLNDQKKSDDIIVTQIQALKLTEDDEKRTETRGAECDKDIIKLIRETCAQKSNKMDDKKNETNPASPQNKTVTALQLMESGLLESINWGSQPLTEKHLQIIRSDVVVNFPEYKKAREKFALIIKDNQILADTFNALIKNEAEKRLIEECERMRINLEKNPKILEEVLNNIVMPYVKRFLIKEAEIIIAIHLKIGTFTLGYPAKDGIFVFIQQALKITKDILIAEDTTALLPKLSGNKEEENRSRSVSPAQPTTQSASPASSGSPILPFPSNRASPTQFVSPMSSGNGISPTSDHKQSPASRKSSPSPQPPSASPPPLAKGSGSITAKKPNCHRRLFFQETPPASSTALPIPCTQQPPPILIGTLFKPAPSAIHETLSISNKPPTTSSNSANPDNSDDEAAINGGITLLQTFLI